MGNRAVILAQNEKGKLDSIGLYLHWDGSPEQVVALTTYCRILNLRYPEHDGYGWAHLAKITGNYTDRNQETDGCSLGIISLARSWEYHRLPTGTKTKTVLKDVDPGDNGVFIIQKWKVIAHEGGDANAMDNLDMDWLYALLKEINEYQPYHLPEEKIDEFLRENPL